ncbi:hypothetical protein LLG96_16595, partial [bacterium]|nr:hypothetical protein [bacterium]
MLKKLVLAGLIGLMTLGIASSVYAQAEFHGFLLARTIVWNKTYTSRIERYGFQFKETINDEFDWLTEVYIHPQINEAPGRVYMESAYLNWHLKNRLPWDFNVRIGKGRNYCYGITPSYSSRRTSDYSLYSEAFTQMRV